MGLIYLGDALSCLEKISDNSIHMCVTSPPYYGLRNYGVTGQIGLEETPKEYIEKMVLVFREVRRVLRPDGTLWLNIGDSYVGSGKVRNGNGKFEYEFEKCKESTGQRVGKLNKTLITDIYKRKDLIGIPWMLAFALRADGWYLRQDIIWYKPNCMPESSRDRCTKSHEYIFLLSKSAQYYFDYEAIMEAAVGFNNEAVAGSKGTARPNSRLRKGNAKTFRGGGVYTGNKSFNNSEIQDRKSHGNSINETGLRRKRSVWNVATKGYKGAHFATFPPELIKPCILAGSPVGGIVLDPFFGSGTTGEVSLDVNRDFVGIELNSNYCNLAINRLPGTKILSYSKNSGEYSA
jgi:DNA modification methylase